jgi:DNA primase|tara:strand:+ start:1058 stop:2770 length:1713 start_codon:yes stop_codon:yes gene_type:complete
MAQNIPKDFIDSLLERANIVDIIGNYIKLEKKGNDYWARCPFHSEKTSSFSVSENKQFFHCFGCSAHGNSIGFVMDHANKTYPEAIESIANTIGVEIPRDKEASKKYAERKNIQDLLYETKKTYSGQLKNSEAAISYLKERNISGETAKIFGLGYAENNFQMLINKFSSTYSEIDLINAGLIVKKDSNTYDKFRDRIMFPIHDASGNTIAFGGRILKDNKDKPQAKYMNSPETILFSKKKVLYNLHLARKDKKTNNFLQIVEGYMDVIALHQAGIKNVVATLGTAVTQENLTQCFKYTNEIICCFDGDTAGEKAAWQGVENIIPVIKDGDVISFVFLPRDQDPDDIIKQGGSQLWDDNISKKVSIEEFIFRKFSKEFDLDTATGKTQYLKKIEELLKKMSAKILKTILMESLKGKIGSKYLKIQEPAAPKTKSSKYRKNSPMHKAILILMHHPNIVIDQDLINDARIEKNLGIIILKSIIYLIKEKNDMNIARILENFRGESDTYNALTKISTMPIADYDFPEKEFHACICLVIRNLLISQLGDIDPSNLKEFSLAQSKIREIEDKSKNF